MGTATAVCIAFLKNWHLYDFLQVLQTRPSKSGIVTCGEDKQLKFWEFELQPTAEAVCRVWNWKKIKLDSNHLQQASYSLSLNLTKSVELPDSIIAMKYSPDGKYIAVALLDTTVRIYFADSMKLFLTLYGHKVSYSPQLFHGILLTCCYFAAPCNDFGYFWWRCTNCNR